MPDPISAGIGAVTSIGGGLIQGSAAKRAGRAQTQAMQQAIGSQRETLDSVRKLFAPYLSAGGPAVAGLMDLAGIGGPRFDAQTYFAENPDVAAEWTRVAGQGQFNSPEEYARWHFDTYGKGEGRQAEIVNGQEAAFAQIENSPGFQAIARQGEEAILQNASATGGLRGGNTQGALARFRPQLLDQFIERQFGRMAGIANMGQNAAGAVGNAAISTGNNIADLMVGQGQARAGAIGAQGQIWSNTLGQIGGMATNMFGNRAGSMEVARLTPSVNSMMAANPGIF